MSKYILYILAFVFPLNIFAISPIETDSVKLWNYEGTTALNFSQVSFTHWAAGGQSSISATGLVKFSFSYKDSCNVWDNSIDMAYGVIRQGNVGSLAKSDDRIELNSSYGWSAFKKWYYNMSLNLKSQAAAGYKTPSDTLKISDFLAPAYLTLSIGMSHNNTDSGFGFQVLPLSGKITYVNNQSLANTGAFGVDEALFDNEGNLLKSSSGKRSEFGGSMKFQYKNEIWDNVSLDTKATLFSNYKDKASSIDVDWQLLVLMKINKYLTANINSHLIYDEDVDIALDLDNDGEYESSGPRVQFKELFGLGLSYSF
jgi:hypothetical protein